MWLIIAILVVIIALGIVAYYGQKRERALFKKTGKHPVGYYRNKGMGLGIAFGVALGLPFDNIALGIPIGLVIGLAIGESWEKKHAKELRPLTKAEEKRQKQAALWGVGFGVLVAIIILVVLVMR